MASLESQFDQAMFNLYRRIKSEAGYNPTIFLGMIGDRGGIATAKYLIGRDQPSDGYTHLYERNRLDLTVEAIVVESTVWHSLFSDVELTKARKRLASYGYKLAG